MNPRYVIEGRPDTGSRRVVAHRLCAPVDLDLDHIRLSLGFDGLLDAASDTVFQAEYLGNRIQGADWRGHPTTRPYAIVDLLASIGEGLEAAVIAATEAAGLQHWASTSIEDKYDWMRDGHLLPERFLWESTAQFLIGAGHRVVNLLLQIALMDDSLPEPPKKLSEVVRLNLATSGLPDHEKGWLSESHGARVADWAARSSEAKVVALAGIVRGWVAETSEWRVLADLRAREHHRWRPPTESDGSGRGEELVSDVASLVVECIVAIAPSVADFGSTVAGVVGSVSEVDVSVPVMTWQPGDGPPPQWVFEGLESREGE